MRRSPAADHLIALVGSTALTTGCFLSWVDLRPLERMKAVIGPVRGIVDPFAGIRGPHPVDSFILLCVGTVAVLVAGYAALQGRGPSDRRFSLFYLVSGMFTIGLAYLDLRDILSRASVSVRAFREFSRGVQSLGAPNDIAPLGDIGVLSFVGIGLYPTLAGGLCLLAAGAWAFVTGPSRPPESSPRLAA